MKSLIKKDLKYVWHPYTQMKDCGKFPPILIERGRGVKLYDIDGKFYYDTISSWWCNVHGHGHPEINKAIKKQLDKLEHVLFAGFTHKPAVELAEKLVRISPGGLNKVFFSDNGSTAVETALKMSFQYWQNIGRRDKTKFVSFGGGFHGDTIGAMSVSGVDLFNSPFSKLFFKSYKIKSPLDIKGLENLLEAKSDKICAVIVEPLLMAAGGMIIYPKENLLAIAKLAKKFNVHFIVDEVATGFGRTGKMFACGHAGIRPDFMCLSKGITAGYMAMGVTLTTDKVYSAFYGDYEEGKTFFHGHTYTANPLACAAACASLDVFEKEKTLMNVRRISLKLSVEINEFKKYDFVKDVRSIGVIGVIELKHTTGARCARCARNTRALEIYRQGLACNLILRPLGNIIYLFLPLSVRPRELEDIINRTHRVFRKVSGLEEGI